ncbi:MAG TPA: hypothetical protein VMF05_04735 [Stellaceae bacterium]|nr:hypothetical protein [Stellaceae bacterium]
MVLVVVADDDMVEPVGPQQGELGGDVTMDGSCVAGEAAIDQHGTPLSGSRVVRNNQRTLALSDIDCRYAQDPGHASAPSEAWRDHPPGDVTSCSPGRRNTASGVGTAWCVEHRDGTCRHHPARRRITYLLRRARGGLFLGPYPVCFKLRISRPLASRQSTFDGIVGEEMVVSCRSVAA